MTSKLQIKQLLFRCCPDLAARIFSARARAYAQEVTHGKGSTELNDKLIRNHGPRALRGPFAGIALSPMTRREHLAPYLLGIYEAELHPTWETIFRMSFAQALDVGAKFGFYAVALAKRFPQAEVVAFDPDPWAQRATKEMCRENGATNVAIENLCTPEWLDRNLAPHSFVLSDCEGYEATLFSAAQAPALASATLLIEVHEHFSPGVTDALRSRFVATHRITEIAADGAGIGSPPELADLSSTEQALALNEFRTVQQSWLFLVPQDQAAGRLVAEP